MYNFQTSKIGCIQTSAQSSVDTDSLFAFRGAKAGIVVFSSTDRESFNNISRFLLVIQIIRLQYYNYQTAISLYFQERKHAFTIKRWKKKLEAECNDIAIVLVRNKIDLQPDITE